MILKIDLNWTERIIHAAARNSVPAPPIIVDKTTVQGAKDNPVDDKADLEKIVMPEIPSLFNLTCRSSIIWTTKNC